MLTDLRYSLRGLMRTPGLTLALVLSIALGVGGNAIVAGYILGSLTDRIGGTLIAAAVAVFLVACANVSALLLSRAARRARETAVRVAIGASRSRIARLMLADAALIAIVGTAAGASAALWASKIVPALLFSQDAESLQSSPHPWIVIAACALCAGITTLCGLVPILEVRDDKPYTVLHRESGGPSNTSRRIRAVLVTGQMACCCVLLITTGVLFAQFRAALRTTVGNRLGEPVLATVSAEHKFDDVPAGRSLFRGVEKVALATPGVTSVAWTSQLPGVSPSLEPLRVEPVPTALQDVDWRTEIFPPAERTTSWFQTQSGRMFGGRDTRGSCRAVMLNASAAALIGGDPVGRLIEDPAGQRIEIVGVVSLMSAAGKPEPAPPTVYYYTEQIEPPVTPGSVATFRIPTWTTDVPEVSLDSHIISPNYVEAVGAEIVDGVGLDAVSASGCPSAIVNEEADQALFDGHAIGRAILTLGGHRIDIVGVVKTPPLRVSQREVAPAIFYPMAENFRPRMTMVMGTEGPVRQIVDALTTRLGAVAGQLVPPDVRTLDEHLRWTGAAFERIAVMLIGAAAVLAVLLSTIGVYGAMVDMVRDRGRELALRVALGAPGWRLVAQVIAGGARLAGAGALIGGLGALAVVRWVLPVPPGANPWPTAIGTPVFLGVMVIVAAILPARRAIRADPISLIKDA